MNLKPVEIQPLMEEMAPNKIFNSLNFLVTAYLQEMM